ncbi:hypothetical protein P154DRAFT_47270 [Amniculicola lignicola CBS 123094]|uniref:Zn(2)-C6 fungal-type domain-containing protein n=1 Tax=Amniculicola lignicola CBS 123094 TaxID=1392246 RepID=A0A6A5VW26_9PLEO|nr:hypothetical protein P154DRAFT_47270 [Amniculicola lignicola CBS 123094]
MEDRETIRRRRPALSCVECRRRKVKCDRNDPCANCVTARCPCAYKTHGNSRPDRYTARQTERWGSTSSTATPQAGRNSPSTEHPGRFRDRTASVSAEARRRREDHADLENASGERAEARAQQTGVPDCRQIVPSHRDQRHANQSGASRVMLNKTRVLRWSHWMGTTPEFARVFHPYAETFKGVRGVPTDANPIGDTPRSVHISELLHRCKGLAKEIKIWRPSRCLSCPQTGFLCPPSREVANKMSANYFRLFESTHRILHIPTFWKEYQRYWDNTEPIPMSLRLKILLVIGIGSVAHNANWNNEPNNDFRKMVHQWVYTAQTWLSGPLEKDRLNITGIQVCCLTILARELFSIGGDLVWMSTGSLVNRAMQIGLHRDPKNLPPMPVLEMELRRRLWATVLEMVVQSSLDSGLPPRLSLDDFDTCAPSNINDDEIDESSTTLPHHPIETFTTSSVQLFLLDSFPTRLQIVQTLNGLKPELSYPEVLVLSDRLTAACKATTEFTRRITPAKLSPFNRNILDFLTRRFLIPLHCPFATQVRTNPMFYYSLKTSLDAAIALVSLEPDEDFRTFMVLTGGSYREGMRCAATIISLEIIVQIENQRLDGTLHRGSSYRQLLKSHMQTMIARSEERIRHGETNIKFHLFANMILAYVRAMEDGVSCEMEMSKAAKESLEYCVRMLEELERGAGVGELQCPHDVGFTPASFDEGMDVFGYGLGMDFTFADAGLF